MADFQKYLGQIARTLVYEDSMGTLLLTFDVGPTEQQSREISTLFLSRQSLVEIGGKHVSYFADTKFERERIAASSDRVRQYCAFRAFFVISE